MATATLELMLLGVKLGSPWVIGFLDVGDLTLTSSSSKGTTSSAPSESSSDVRCV